MYSRSFLALLALFVSFFATTTAKHAPSTHCNVYDILEDCKDRVIEITKGGGKSLGELDNYLIDECKGMSGLIVAKCLMKYLCINHGEKAVERVDECVRDVCPLAKRLPKKLCHKRRLGGKALFVENVLEKH
ncbi:expressed unknown protein [Seminavis robusta]|uniref:Uncharacterized protein n=1 Tax=Seminavis robusta TaxID=568900 RepID=A0A9N8HNS2_9STRA|nr:expressed unknown protein [Seminavis robusta]|eukprot:Sro1111_g242400.1 n/a (132) ;mRNA; r:3724-4119